jgi:tocopherol O-methyltransferase
MLERNTVTPDAASEPAPSHGDQLATRAQYLQSVERYYEETWSDYRAVWMNSANRALHFGYWDGSVRNHAGSLIRMNEIMAEEVGVGAGDRVLDAGCGVGGTAMWLAAELQARVVGISITMEHVLRARTYARRRGLQDQVTFEIADFADTALPSESFDVVWAQESVCHDGDSRPFLQEAYRLLRPGGHVVVEDWFAAKKGINRDLGWPKGFRVPPVLVAMDSFSSIAEAVGFSDARSRDLRPYVRRSLRRLFVLGCLFFPAMTVRHRTGGRSAEQQDNLRAAIKQYPSFLRSEWTIGLFTAAKPLTAAPMPSNSQDRGTIARDK